MLIIRDVNTLLPPPELCRQGNKGCYKCEQFNICKDWLLTVLAVTANCSSPGYLTWLESISQDLSSLQDRLVSGLLCLVILLLGRSLAEHDTQVPADRVLVLQVSVSLSHSQTQERWFLLSIILMNLFWTFKLIISSTPTLKIFFRACCLTRLSTPSTSHPRRVKSTRWWGATRCRARWPATGARWGRSGTGVRQLWRDNVTCTPTPSTVSTETQIRYQISDQYKDTTAL